MRAIKLFLSCLAAALITKASTFVGNGGNAGDVELQVTISQLTKTLQQIKLKNDDAEGKLCLCEAVMRSHKICNTLESLNQRQVYYCGDILTQTAPELLDLIQSKDGVQVTWTSEEINVSEKSGHRLSNAVAQRNSKAAPKIVINQKAFLEMRDYERIFLISHELGHLVKIENKYVHDEDVIGPFKQSDGGRQLLNSLAAALAMKSISGGQIQKYEAVLSRSKNYSLNWFSVAIDTNNNRKDESTFALSNYRGWNASFRRQLNHELGLSLQLRSQKSDGNFLTMTSAESVLRFTNLQVNWRLFPFKDPLSFLGQSHFILGAGYEIGTADLMVSDEFTSVSESAKLSAPVLSALYHMPIQDGLWGHLGAHYSAHRYEFNEIGYKSEASQLALNLGVSYGF